MIQQGSKFTYLRDESENPLKSPNTHLAAALIACGGKFSEYEAYTDIISKNLDGSPKRTVVWLFDEIPIHFYLLDGKEETITTSEFFRRWKNDVWLNENQNHPICYIKTYQEKIIQLRNHIKNSTPLIEVKKGGMIARINPKDPKEKTEKLLSFLK